ncbi:MAG: Dolichyl-phosphate-mannose--protein O-mannosyl transferase-like protein, partial [Actinomycetia bacterium]|nr:Dolichyl-phosphate-mannose--protein O-mannosyl transferase-like protein [Actinomycetes bacterium]
MSVAKGDHPTMDPDEAGPVTRDPGISVANRPTGQPDVAARIAAVRSRLLSPMPADGIWGWAGPLLVTAFAAFFRFYRLSVPHAVVFDETYYVKDAW